MTPPTGAKQAGGAPLPDCPATPLLTLSRRLLLSPRTSRACNSQGMTGGAISRREARVCLTAALPPFSSVHPNPASPHLPPHAPPRCGLVWSGGALSRREARLPLFAALPPFSSYHPNPCLTAPLDPPSLPVTTTPLPPPIPCMRPPGVVWWRTQQAGGAPLPVCRTPPLLFLSPQSRFPPSSPACTTQGRSGAALTQQAGGAPLPVCRTPPLLFLSSQSRFPPSSTACTTQGRSGAALSRWEARLCLTAPLDPPSLPVTPTPLPPPIPRMRPPGVVWWRTQQSGGAPLPVCRTPPLLFLSPQSRFPPSSLACATQGRSGAALSRWEARLCLTAPLDPPSLPVTPTPLPPPIPRMRPPGVVWWRTQQSGGAPLPVCRTPPLLFLSPQSRFPPSSPACATQGRSGAALSRWEARLCLSAPLDPPSLPITPTPLPPPIPRMRPPGVVWWRTQQAGGAPLPDCRTPPLLFLSPQSRFPPSSPACASQGRSGAALSRWEARLCLTAPLDPPSHPITPTPLPPPIPRMRPPGVVWWRTQQVGGAPLPDCRTPPLLYLSPQSRRSRSPCTLPPLSSAHPPFRGGSHMTLVAHSAGGYVECLF
ncbi:unnamed protein product [Closterium sp. NIES-64]|nr:unnamed protein product [Closterium sp. NIES-64]